jgi:hypothetical protein
MPRQDKYLTGNTKEFKKTTRKIFYSPQHRNYLVSSQFHSQLPGIYACEGCLEFNSEM